MTSRPSSRRTSRPMGVPTRAPLPPRPTDEATGWGHAALALLPLGCVALGGGVERWSQALVLLALGGLLLAAPPRASLGRGVNTVLVALLVLGLTAFLPAAWFGLPAWRRSFADDFGVALPGTLSAQPWLSAESWIVFLAGASWFYSMATVNWQPGERRRAGMVFAAGVAVLAAVFVGLSRLGVVVPIWPNQRHFGSFPNRNQTADFLAVGALPLLALARAGWRAGRIRSAVGWLVGWLVVAGAVFQCFSRAGIAILFATTTIFLGLEYLRAMHRPAPTHNEAKFAPWRRVALLFSVALVATSVFLAVGGDTLERLRPGSAYSEGNTVSNDLRLRIQADALDMTTAAPWAGVGIGNFGSLFEVYRHQSANAPLRSIHPESDWLWLAAEMGWPALVVALVGCALVSQRMWPSRQSHDRPLRTAAAIGVVAFLIHGLFDVSAHRLGTAMCAVFLAGLALPGPNEAVASNHRLAALFRVVGLVLITVGIVWTLEARGVLLLPGAQGVARLKSMALGQGLSHDYADAQQTATRALAWAPLDWELYFIRAGAQACQRHDLEATEMDFRRARFLERCSPTLPMDEARLWAAVRQDPQAINALLEACRRDPTRPGDFIGPIYLLRRGDAGFVDGLGTAVLRSPALSVASAERLEGADAAGFIARYLQADPELARLDDGQKVRFFQAWAFNGDPQTLAAGMSTHPAWQVLGWRWWAEACARGNTPEAWEQAARIAAEHVPAPDVPVVHDARSLAQLRRDAAAVADDPALMLALYRAQRAAGDSAGGLTTLQRATSRNDSPSYFIYLEAQTATDMSQWKMAWRAWHRYLVTVANNR